MRLTFGALFGLSFFASCQLLQADAFVYSAGIYMPVVYPGATAANTLAVGINNAGTVVGTAGVGFVDSNGTFTSTTDPVVNISDTVVNGINAAGQTVGVGISLGAGIHGFENNNGTFSPISYPGATAGTIPFAINSQGQIVGVFENYTGLGGVSTGFFLDSGRTFTQIALPGSAYTDETYSKVGGINNAGQIVGTYVDSSGVSHGFLYANGVLTTIDVPGSRDTVATGINNQGEIVGWYLGGDDFDHGFMDIDNNFDYFNYPAAGNVQLYDVNDAGQIVLDGDALMGAPEPKFLFLIGAGLLGFSIFRTRLRRRIS